MEIMDAQYLALVFSVGYYYLQFPETCWVYKDHGNTRSFFKPHHPFGHTEQLINAQV